MLINVNIPRKNDPILAMIGGSCDIQELSEGVYELHHFSFDRVLKENHYKLKDWPELQSPSGDEFPYYGVCDNYDQILSKCPDIIANDKQYVISLTAVLKDEQSSSGGWRWHKWGEYIGNYNPQHEYIFDEEDIEKVYCYTIHEIDVD